MRRSIALLVVISAVMFLVASVLPALAEDAPANGRVIVPESSIRVPGKIHTNLLIFVPDGEPIAQNSPPSGANTPASLACVYNLVTQVSGCPISGSKNLPTGGSKAIALVDVGGNSSTIANDLKTFDKQFGLPNPTFKEVCVGSGGCSPQGTWQLEEALDVEWAHAMAPKATIYLVECAGSCSGNAIFTTEAEATKLVTAAGGGEVSNSWGYSDFSGENQYDTYFQTAGIVYFASAGDTGGEVSYPSASPDVVSAGGTSVERNGSGDFTGEAAWGSTKGSEGAGGGPSQYESRPSYQKIIKKIVGTHRGTPDISYDANPNTGVAIYSTPYGGWVQVGGTSVSSPALAGVINAAGTFNTSSKAELTELYKEYGNSKDYKAEFRNITTGSNGYACAKGWTFCAGIGSPITYTGK
jgi:kumamolisin